MLTLPGWVETIRTQRTKRLALCYRIARKDGVIHRFTAHNRKLIARAGKPPLATAEYTPVASPSPESARGSSGVAPRSASIFGPVSALPGLAAEDLRVGLLRGAEVLAFVVDWRFAWNGPLILWKYFVGDVTFSGERFEIELRSIADRADVQVGRVYHRRCDAELGDERCGVNLALFQSGTKTVTAVDGFTGANKRLRFRSTLTTPSDKWWSDGVLHWLTGPNAITGFNQHQIKTSRTSNGEIELWTPTPYDIAIGNTFYCDPGCGKDAQRDCRKKFNNIENHRGFPFMRGADHVVRTPDARS